MAINSTPKLEKGLIGALHRLEMTGLKIFGKDVAVKGYMAGAASGLASNSMLLLGGLGLTGGVSAGVTQLAYQHELSKIKHLYNDEIAAKLHKPVKQLTNDDMFLVAKGSQALGIEPNHTMAEALDKTRRQRNMNVVLSVISSLASFAVLTAAFGAGMFAGMGPVTEIIAQGALGLLSYNTVKAPLKWVGDKLFGVDKETTHDRIMGLEKDREHGANVSQEQVFSVIVSANPQLGEMISKKYGREYDLLSRSDKTLLAHNVGGQMGIQSLADDVNKGKVSVTELAFICEGQTSGVLPNAVSSDHESGIIHWVKEKVSHATDAVLGRPSEQDMIAALPLEKKIRAVVEYDNNPTAVMHAERVGRARRTSLSPLVSDQVTRDQNTQHQSVLGR